LTASTFAFLIVGGQALVGNVYEANGISFKAQAFEWLLPTVCPTAGLMLGVLASLELNAEANRAARNRSVSRFFFRLTMAMSLVYLLVVLTVPWVASSKGSAIRSAGLLTDSNYVLGPLQGLVNIVLGVFFVSSKESTTTEVVVTKP
jgi:hypothetical protein